MIQGQCIKRSPENLCGEIPGMWCNWVLGIGSKWALGLALVLIGMLPLWRAERRTYSEQVVAPLRLSGNVQPTQKAPTMEGASLFQGQAEKPRMTKNAPDSGDGDEALQTWAENINVVDIPSALQQLQLQNQTEDVRDAIVQLIRRWAENDVHGAANWVARMPSGGARPEALNGVVIAWANQDLGEAICWVCHWPVDVEQQSALYAFAYEAARIEPEETLRLAMAQPAQPEWDELIRYAAMQWTAINPENASTWAEQIADEPLREQVLSSVATVWGETDPVAAAKLALETMLPGRLQDDAGMGIVQRWVQKDPEMTAAWVAQFPEGGFKQTAVENVVKLWAEKDAQQVEIWLNGLTDAFLQETAVVAFTGWLTPAFPAAAARWAESIRDDNLRQQQMELVGRSWLENDEPVALAWIAQTTLPETVKSRLLEETSSKTILPDR